MKPVVIDCAPGVYEGIALALAVKSGLDIRAVTVNALFEAPEKAATDAAGLCRVLGITAPVVMGAEAPVIAHVRTIVDRYPRLPDGMVSGGTVQPGYAWDEIYRQAAAAQGKLTMICLGPLTNLAIALFKYPELKDMLKEVVFFGGALDWGNVSQTAEVNVAADPHGADAVNKAGLKLTMVPWSVTCREAVNYPDAPENPFVIKLFRLLEARESIPVEEKMVLNHGWAVLYAAEKPGFTTKMHIIRVETASSLCMGRTCANLMYSLKKDPPNVNVIRTVNAAEAGIAAAL